MVILLVTCMLTTEQALDKTLGNSICGTSGWEVLSEVSEFIYT